MQRKPLKSSGSTVGITQQHQLSSIPSTTAACAILDFQHRSNAIDFAARQQPSNWIFQHGCPTAKGEGIFLEFFHPLSFSKMDCVARNWL
jgi:hypothetical protein